MKNRSITAAALALVVTPFGVDAEILSQKRLGEILNSQAPGPVDVETIRARDKDLLVSLGVTLREKYGSVLTGSEIVFTRSERAGRIVYRMDFIGVKTQDHARGICQILEVENCVILDDDGSASLLSAEIDEDGLLSLDEFIPFSEPVSGPVRMQKLPATGPAWVDTKSVGRLPAERPEIEDGSSSLAAEPETGVEVVDDTASEEISIEAPEIKVEVGSQADAVSTDKDEAPAGAQDTVAPGTQEQSSIEIDPPVVSIDYDVVTSVTVVADPVLPMTRPSVITLASVAIMDLPIMRPAVDALLPTMKMALPTMRPVSQFGLTDHLPIPRDAAIRLAEASSESVVPHSMIADGFSEPVFGQGYEIVQGLSEVAAGLEGFSLADASSINISIPGAGAVALPEDLPSISVMVERREISAVVQKSDTGLEMEIAGMDGSTADQLPRVFVLSFAEDGVKAFPNARVEPAKPSFEIAQVVMTDAFSKPFDVRGDGRPDLQKLPRLRPDLSVYDNDIALVSSQNASVLLDQLLDEPVQVAQMPVAPSDEESPAERLMKRLSTMEDDAAFKPAEIKMNLEPATPQEDNIQTEDIAQTTVPEPDALPKASDGLVDLDAMGAESADDKRRQALSVLGEIAQMKSDQSDEAPSQKSLSVSSTPNSQMKMAMRSPVDDERGIFDVAAPKDKKEAIAANPELRIELSYATSREEVSRRASELEAYIPDVIMEKGRFYGFRMPTAPETYIIGIEARDQKSRDDIIWYLERMQIPWAIRRG